jgi:hypothetical protein
MKLYQTVPHFPSLSEKIPFPAAAERVSTWKKSCTSEEARPTSLKKESVSTYT